MDKKYYASKEYLAWRNRTLERILDIEVAYLRGERSWEKLGEKLGERSGEGKGALLLERLLGFPTLTKVSFDERVVRPPKRVARP